MKHFIKIKVNFRETLAIIYPNYKLLFDNPFGLDSLIFLKCFPHPELFLNQSPKEVYSILYDQWNHKEIWIRQILKKTNDFMLNTASGCEANDPNVLILLTYINQIEYYQTLLKKIIHDMKTLAKDLPLYPLIHSLPGIKDILTVRFIAELGDISRFHHYKSIVAYAGIDPMIRQSGDKDGLHMKISKKGNRRLRTVLHLMVVSMIKKNRDANAIRDKYQKRTQHLKPLKPKVASMACANQIVRIIFYMHKKGSVYHYPIAS